MPRGPVLEWKDAAADVLAQRVVSAREALIEWNSTLLVRSDQKAVLAGDGKAIASFEAGRHALTTQAFPALARCLTASVSARQPSFKVDLWFVRTGLVKDVRWSCERIPHRDPTLRWIHVDAEGRCALRVDDAATFVTQGRAGAVRASDLRRELGDAVARVLATREGELGAEIGEYVRGMVSAAMAPSGLEIVELTIGSLRPPPGLDGAAGGTSFDTAPGLALMVPQCLAVAYKAPARTESHAPATP